MSAIAVRRAPLRRLELSGIVMAAVLVALAFALLSGADSGHIESSLMLRVLIYLAAAIVTSLALSRLLPDADQVMFPVVVLLGGVGLVEVTRLSPTLGNRQLLWLVIGDGLLLVTAVWPRNVNWLRLYKYTWASIGFFLILLTIVHGSDIGATGYRRWIGFGGIYLQPVEFLKIFMVIFFAAYLDEKRELLQGGRLVILGVRLPPFQYLIPLLIMWGLSLLLLIRQDDLGSALLFLGIFLAMLYVGTSRPIYPALGGALFVLGTAASYFLFSHVRLRTDIWLNPWGNPSGYQLIQGLFAFAAGGIAGQGIGLGHPALVPVAYTDFIWAALGEELGLAGLVALLAAYLLLVFRGLDIAMTARDGFQKLMAAGLVSVFAIQTIVIIGGNTRLIPLTGVPLPFLSYGGSSIVANFIILGLLLKLSQTVSVGAGRTA
ncbi:MAG TPA: FtsW/RodA/SpoVE family cell cycle protein [Chloroflexota bacterium]|jgi:cell division protein FtsW|nr:FtsW/RodA/SpoVE family cell cycle protein [Chloroflexota bacterium]